ncbi:MULTISPECIES: hypothetical protein [Paenarthrobacter]|uniref:Uncharacterized protein n=1 Tax=Paenarthrobacter ureafaciens TaxID=37931 RepID=A0AAX3EDV6_PAEUR|nr:MULTISPECIES: hypothetical protein [Paenarthrobacter]MDO5865195.1 hypothetical protein [Paenarthrobacter sp. SD-2]MDO5876272.1 hypothetical protein [Paenarthrobacter sp. SD-1]QMU83003.1 hypothetical protein FV140_13455 [Paenarthrobacter ureafaciens]UYV91542.1 hypothetical protein NL395_13380 [Paenarthrobacter ureafaciens]UYV96061.1 hypothetical protein NL394_13325 [Paenarthrobacter ureafaciens]
MDNCTDRPRNGFDSPALRLIPAARPWRPPWLRSPPAPRAPCPAFQAAAAWRGAVFSSPASLLAGVEGIGTADPDLTTKDNVPVLPALHWRPAVPGISCPNDGAPMESDAPATARERTRRRGCACTHTCPECGYIEIR